MDEDYGNCKTTEHVAEEAVDAPRSSMLYMVASKARHLLAFSGAAGTLIFASVFLVLAYRRKKRLATASPDVSEETPATNHGVVGRANPVLYRSVSLAMLHGGEKAMQRLMDAHEACSDESKLSSALDEMRNELDKDRMDFNKLHAAVYAMKGETDRSKEWYEKFKDIRKTYHGSKFYSTGSALHMTLPEFDQFEKVANNLKKTIWHAHLTKTIAQTPETKTADDRVDKETRGAQQQAKALANTGKK
ncbi:hypothetical protein GW17_00030930 [Ensete ventricosum]|nr:hypothetical protein GW17_00030930 [Ensete ventricosum]